MEWSAPYVISTDLNSNGFSISLISRLTAGEDRLVGTAGDDVFNAPLVDFAFGQRQTLNSTDILDGGEGTDRLNATITRETAPTIENIEQFYTRAVADDTGSNDGSADFNMANVSGAEQLWNDRSTVNLTYSNVQNSVVIGLNDVRGPGTTTTVNYAVGVDTTEQTIVANGTPDVHNVAATQGSAGNANVRDLTVVATAASGVVLRDGFAGVQNLVISGDAPLALSEAANFEAIRTVDGTEYSGDLSLDISGQEEAGEGALTSVQLGGGDNTLIMGGDLLVESDDYTLDIDLGEGRNTLGLINIDDEDAINALDFTAHNLAGVNALALGDTLTAGATLSDDATLDLDGTDVDELTLVGTWAFGDNDLTIANGQSEFTLNALSVNGENESTLVFDDSVESLTANVASWTDVGVTAAAVTDLTVNVALNGDVELGQAVMNALEVMTVTLAEDASFESVAQGGEAKSLATVAVSGTESSTFTMNFSEQQESLTTVDLSGMAAGSQSTIGFYGPTVETAESASFENTITIKIGEGDLVATTVNDQREIFQFVGDDIGNVTINGFQAGVAGNNDRLDFSQFAGVDSAKI